MAVHEDMIEGMTETDRLVMAAKRQPVDRPPCICPGGMMNMMFRDVTEGNGFMFPQIHRAAQTMAAAAVAAHEAGGFENYGVPFCMTVEAEALGAHVDMGCATCEPHVVEEVLMTSADWHKLPALDVGAGRAAAVVEAIRILDARDDHVPIIGNVSGPLSLAGTIMDTSVLLRELRKKPDDVRAFLDFLCDSLISFAQAQAAAGATAICIAEPSGTGEILGPHLFRAYAIPYLNRVLDAVDVPVKIVHICGNMGRVADTLSDVHCNVFSFDAITPVHKMRECLDHIAVMGNVSTFALGSQSPEKVRTLVDAALRSGVDIVAPACGLSCTTPIANVRVMVDEVRTRGPQRVVDMR